LHNNSSFIPKLSVIIVNHRSEEVLGSCLLSVAESDFKDGLEVIIVDNPLSDEKTNLKTAGLAIKRVSAFKRLGFAEACNLGVSEATGEYLLFLNPDVQLHRDALTNLYQALLTHTGTGLAVGRLTGSDGKFQPICRHFPHLSNLIFSRGSIIYRWFRMPGASYTYPDYPNVTEVEAAAAAMMMVPAVVFKNLGGFDPAFYLYMEDTDLCYRAFKNGYKTLYVPQAQGSHLWGHSTRHYRFRRLVWHHCSVWKYFAKYRPSLLTMAFLGIFLSINCLLSLVSELCTFRR